MDLIWLQSESLYRSLKDRNNFNKNNDETVNSNCIVSTNLYDERDVFKDLTISRLKVSQIISAVRALLKARVNLSVNLDSDVITHLGRNARSKEASNYKTLFPFALFDKLQRGRGV